MKKLGFVLTLLVLAVTGAAYLVSNQNRHNGAEGEFTSLPVEYGELTESISTTGFLQAQEVVVVGSELSGRVVKLYADVNQEVKENEILLELDDRKAVAELNEAEAAVCTARAALSQAEAVRNGTKLGRDKLQRLVKEEVGKQTDLDRVQSELDAAEATVKAAQCRVDQADAVRKKAQLGVDLAVVHAPCRGLVIDRKVTLNQLIAPPVSAQLFVLAKDDLSTMQVHAQVAEGDIGKVRIGQEASFQVYAYSEGDARFKGSVMQVKPMPTSVQGAVYYTVVIEAKNERNPEAVSKAAPQWKLLPGMTATIDIIRRKHAPVWKMPTAALSFQMPEQFISQRQKLSWSSSERCPSRSSGSLFGCWMRHTSRCRCSFESLGQTPMNQVSRMLSLSKYSTGNPRHAQRSSLACRQRIHGSSLQHRLQPSRRC